MSKVIVTAVWSSEYPYAQILSGTRVMGAANQIAPQLIWRVETGKRELANKRNPTKT